MTLVFSTVSMVREAEAGKLFRYHLYKNSQTYEMLHGADEDNEDEEDEEESGEENDTPKQHDGWSSYAEDDYGTQTDGANDFYGHNNEEDNDYYQEQSDFSI